MFSQELINKYVTIDIIIGIIALLFIVVYGGYKFISYLWFCHQLKDSEKDTFEKNPLD